MIKEEIQAKLNIMFEKLAQLENSLSSSLQKAFPSKSGKTLTSSSIKGPLKIDSSCVTGLGTSSSPQKPEKQDDITSLTSPGLSRDDPSTSNSEDIHFDPLIPVPEQAQVITGEEDEEVMFSTRAKHFRRFAPCEQ